MLLVHKSMVRSHVEYCFPFGIRHSGTLECWFATFTLLGPFGSSVTHVSSTETWALHPPPHFHMRKILYGKTSNDLNIQLVSRPSLGDWAVLPSKSRYSSAANQTLFDQSFAMLGPTLWNAMPYHPDLFKSHLAKFMMWIPDTPPIRGYTPPNNNSRWCWKNEQGYTSWQNST